MTVVSSREPCTLENCGHMRQLDAIADFLGMTRGTRSVLDELQSRFKSGAIASAQTTVQAFIERVELTRQRAGSASVAKAYLVVGVVLEEDHEFKVAVPRDFAVAVGKYLETWDDTDQSPRISITFSVKEDE
jgi:hypothetical protein